VPRRAKPQSPLAMRPLPGLVRSSSAERDTVLMLRVVLQPRDDEGRLIDRMLLFHSLTSPYARKVRVFLLEKRLSVDALNVASSGRSASEHNPLGKVPTLVLDDGTVLFDSRVITEALDAMFPDPRLIPLDARLRAIVRHFEALADGICDVLVPVVLDARKSPELRDGAATDKALGKITACLDYLEPVAGGRALVGDAFSLADVAVVSALGYINLRRPELLDGRGALAEYLARQLERPSLAETVPPNLPIRG
jgi:glutathione S-transferase